MISPTHGAAGYIIHWDHKEYVVHHWLFLPWCNEVVCVTKASGRAGTGGTAVLQRRLATASSSDLSLNPSSILLSLHRSSSTVRHLSPVPQPILCVTLFEVGHQRP